MSTITKLEKGNLLTPVGFKAAGMHSGVKKAKNDLGMIYCEQPANAAAVYTLNAIKAAPIYVTKDSIQTEGKIQAVIVNSGNANACTGKQGELDAYEMRATCAKHLSISDHYVAVASTGIIGLQLSMDKIIPSIKKLELGSTAAHADQFNQAILTTDLFGKSTCYEATIDGKTVSIAGCAKGSGMINPNMATMLAFITTDAVIETELLQLALSNSIDKTFNCITVDGDTSTNDTVLTLASCAAGNNTLTTEHKDWPIFVKLIEKTCEDLAKMIARDGEGATKLIEVEVSGAKDDKQAIQIAKSVVGSSLVKTAAYGADANWGRIIAAVGYSGAEVNPETIDMSIGHFEMLKDSQPVPFSEEDATVYLQQDSVKITINLNISNGAGKAWGCDLTYDYVKINASYRS